MCKQFSGLTTCLTEWEVFLQSHNPARKLSEFEEQTVLDCFLDSPGIYMNEIQQQLCDETGTWVSKSTIGVKPKGWDLPEIRKVAI